MKFRLLQMTALIGCAICPAWAQNQNQEEPAYVRRISAGATLSVMGLSMIPGNEMTVTLTTPAFSARHATTSKPQRIGYGFTAQLMLTGRIGVVVNPLLRRVSYKLDTDIHEGVDNPNTIVDERLFRTRDEETRARLLDIPITARYYGKDRHDYGARWFFDVGGAIRKVRNIRSSSFTTSGGGDPVCCDLTPAQPRKKSINGLVGGFGVLVMDEIGVKVVPMVRYTRWLGTTFDSLSTRTRRDQVEAVISITF
jgi:hypothetical protein